MNYTQYQYSVTGPRLENQDAIAVIEKEGYLLACIADGVGGENCGKLAATKSIEEFVERIDFNSPKLDITIRDVHEAIVSLQRHNADCKGMASTFTACMIKDLKLIGCQVGDTRLCVLRGNGIKQLTELHTEANRLYRAGQLTKEAYLNYPRKNIIESAIGMKTTPKVQVFQFDLSANDRILLTSDGIHDIVKKKEFRDISIISSTVESFGASIEERLRSKTLTDNASFIILSI